MKPKPTFAAERLAQLATEANNEGLDNVSRIIMKVKAGEEHGENLKALDKQTLKDELAATYAYLSNCEKKDKEVSMLNKEGLKLMILHQLRTLMPRQCGKCLKDHTQDRLEKPKVTCLRCDHPACPECFSEPVGLNTWVYVCQPCQKVVKDDLGVGRLEEKHFMKSKKKNEVITLDEEDEKEDQEDEEEEEEEEEEDASLNDKQPQKESEEIEGINTAFLPAGWNKRGFKKDAGKSETGKKTDERDKKKICIHHRKGRCKFGLSGKKKIDGEWKKCPFEHPRVCEKLLSNGDRGKLGCKGDCKKMHPKMCFSSLNSKKCPFDKECRNGYHVRGTVKVEKGRAHGPQRQLNLSGSAQGPPNENWKGMNALPQAAPAGQTGSSTFFDLGQKVREEILQVLKELKLTAPAPPPPPKMVSKEDLMGALKELLK